MEQFGPFVHIGIIIALSAIILALGALVMRSMQIDLSRPTRRSSVKGSLLAGALNLAILVITFTLFRKLDGKSPGMMGFRFNDVDLAFSVTILLVTHLLAYLMIRREIGERKEREEKERESKPHGPFPLFLLVAAIFLGAWQEEVVYRGYLFAHLLPYGLGLTLALSVILFTAIHFVTGNVSFWKIINWVLGGIILALVYLFSGSIWVATAAHFARNLANLLLLLDAPGFSLVLLKRPISDPARTLYYAILSAATVGLVLLFYGTGGGLSLLGPFPH